MTSWKYVTRRGVFFKKKNNDVLFDEEKEELTTDR